MQITPLDPADRAEAAALLSLCSGARAEGELDGYLRNESARIYAAYDPRPVGLLIALETNVSEVLDVAVHPAHRRKGIAAALIERAAADSANPAQMLEVRASNPARSLYEKLGFEEISVRRGYYSDPREDAIIMRRTI